MTSVPFAVVVATLSAVMAAIRPSTGCAMSLLSTPMRMLPGSAGTVMSSAILVLLASTKGLSVP